MHLIELNDVSKHFGKTKAIDKVSLNLAPNKIHGLLGRNGAGKTTLLNIITNRIFPDRGTVRIGGKNTIQDEQILRSVFYVTEKNLFPEGSNLKELLYVCKDFYPSADLSYAHKLAAKFKLNLKQKISGLSSGYMSIFKAIMALCSNAPIFILDEPVTGLDANHRELLYKEILAIYAANSQTIIISTHLIEEIASLLEDVVIIDHGKILLKDSTESLLEKAWIVAGEAGKVHTFTKSMRILKTTAIGGRSEMLVFGLINQQQLQAGKDLGLEFAKASLQKVFVGLTENTEVNHE